MHIGSPIRSRARISFKTNVCESRGQVLTTYPTIEFRSGCVCINDLSEQFQYPVSGPICTAHVHGFVACGIVVSLEIRNEPFREDFGAKVVRIEHIDQGLASE